MTTLHLPPSLKPVSDEKLKDLRQLTIIGGNGAGKSRFMDEMMNLCGDKAYCMNVLSAFYPERDESTMQGSVDSLYRKAVKQQGYMRTDAVSELDKILYMLFADELDSLLKMKEEVSKEGRKFKIKPSKLDIIRRHWERIFPGNRIVTRNGRLMFATKAGDDLISPSTLSQGEKAVLYYLGAAMYAMPEAVIFVDSPTLFVHPSILGNLWNSIEELRNDCTFVYNSVDEDFISTRTHNACVWVKSFDSERHAWDYDIIGSESLSEDIRVEFAGTRRSVLFIEGDERHSIDVRLYSLVFTEMTVRPVGSCNKVIETTRAFNSQTSINHLKSYGIVDRDRRSEQEVAYLRAKKIMVPDVAEIENIFLLPGVIKLMARRRGRDDAKIMRIVKREVTRMFKRHAEEQALQHVRHKVKRDVECKIDARFSCITALEAHLRGLINKLEPRKHYNRVREQFAVLVRDNDYEGILQVFNHKPMLPESGVHQLLGYRTKEDYISGVLDVLKSSGKDSSRLRALILHCLHADEFTTKDQPQQMM